MVGLPGNDGVSEPIVLEDDEGAFTRFVEAVMM
jgi:hypothetical protein